ncbi:MAG: hypothetical protein WDM91_02315 [Rhizomicrobium sp.]
MKDDELEVMFDRVRAWPEARKERALGLLAALDAFDDVVYPLTGIEIAELETAILETDEASDKEVVAAFGRPFR